nr:hypothetical protein Iba_chr05fCG7250 [Ipomoea batatas]
MVVINIIKFPILEGIKLYRHHMVRRIAIGGVIEKAEIRVGKCPRKASRGRDGEGKAVGEQTRILGHHSTDKSGGEGESRGVGGILESDRHGAQIGRPESVECELQPIIEDYSSPQNAKETRQYDTSTRLEGKKPPGKSSDTKEDLDYKLESSSGKELFDWTSDSFTTDYR